MDDVWYSYGQLLAALTVLGVREHVMNGIFQMTSLANEVVKITVVQYHNGNIHEITALHADASCNGFMNEHVVSPVFF
jgi:hypothetical protein